MPSHPSNHLIHEKSPYLLQHAHNPVDWHPWGDLAIEKARREDKPIFLSIGYSTCHWCHVMEHESFENPDIAALLNEHFVSIKVDREERPDLDQIYMAATQAMTGSGGWPMSVWLNHELKPFFAGTYFPPDSRYGRPGFRDVLLSLHHTWVDQRARVDATSERMHATLRDMTGAHPPGEPLTSEIFAEACSYFERSFDKLLGGFGNAPKFPRAVQFPFLLRHHPAGGNPTARNMALFTLEKMARGGIYDQLGGGFHRYSVDAEWRVPHFEKMLYDNAQLLGVFVEAWQITHDSFHHEIARDIIHYITRDMTDPGGAFHSAEDADSEGAEGTFYVWTEEEVVALLGRGAAEVIFTHYDFQKGGNFEHGKNVLHNILHPQETAEKIGKSEEEVRKSIDHAKKKLFEARCKRPRPHLDDKILTAWNGLMISGLARAGLVFDDSNAVANAAHAAEFILTHLRDPKSGNLLRRYRDGEARVAAFLDDYAFFIAGLLDLFEASQDPHWLGEAVRLVKEQIGFLWDDAGGGFFFARSDDPTLLLRPKNDYEGAEPSGNAISAHNLLRLAHLTGDTSLHAKGEQTIRSSATTLKQFPAAMPLMLCAFQNSLEAPKHLVVAGDPMKSDTQAMWRFVRQIHLPNTLLLLADGGEGQNKLSQYLPVLKDMKPLQGKPTAYFCENFTCQAPTNDLVHLKKILVQKYPLLSPSGFFSS